MGEEKNEALMVPVKMHVPLSMDKIKDGQGFYVSWSPLGSEFVFCRWMKKSWLSVGSCEFLAVSDGPRNTPGMMVFRCTDSSAEARKCLSNYTLFEYKLHDDKNYNRVESIPVLDEDMYRALRNQSMILIRNRAELKNSMSLKRVLLILCGVLGAAFMISVWFAYRTSPIFPVTPGEKLAAEPTVSPFPQGFFQKAEPPKDQFRMDCVPSWVKVMSGVFAIILAFIAFVASDLTFTAIGAILGFMRPALRKVKIVN